MAMSKEPILWAGVVLAAGEESAEAYDTRAEPERRARKSAWRSCIPGRRADLERDACACVERGVFGEL